MSRDEGENLVSIQHQKLDGAYTEIRFSFVFSDTGDPTNSLNDMDNGNAYVWNIQNLVLEEDETGVQSGKSHIHVNAVGQDPTVSAAAVSCNVHSGV